MSRSNHPIEQEELMAYLDGELATNRAIAAAAHLEHCAECQELAADLRKLSQELMGWEVEQAESSSEISDENCGGSGAAEKGAEEEERFRAKSMGNADYAAQDRMGFGNWLDWIGVDLNIHSEFVAEQIRVELDRFGSGKS